MDEVYKDQVCQVIKEEIDKEYDSPVITWEMIKMPVRGFTIKYASRRKKHRSKRLKALTKQAKQLEEKLGTSIDEEKAIDEENYQNYIDTMKEIEEINSEQTQGAMLRCKLNCLEYREKNNKYFSQLEKYNFNKCNLNKLRSSEGELLISQKEVVEELARFFKDLYKRGPHSADEMYLNDLEFPKLSERDKAWLDRVIDIDEIEASMRHMKPNKCPGTDGLPVEFFRTFGMRLR